MKAGPRIPPALITLPTALVAVAMGVTVPEMTLATQAVVPSGVIAIASGAVPTLIARPALLVAVRIGVTVSALLLAA